MKDWYMAKDALLLGIKKFVESRLVKEKSLLLGCSGGPDSKALLYLLLKCKRFIPFDLHVAHIDHGWREESGMEALQLQEEVESLGLPFHLKTLKKQDFRPGNWEKQGRDYRLAFFRDLYKVLGAQGLVLGHHADDWAEVVLKRLFEGASLPSLGGMALHSSLNGMSLYRPLLPFSKKQIVDWLSERGLSYFIDLGNESPEFLRGRIRLEMIPFLTQSFGKQISSNLCRLGGEAQELKAYFDALNHSLLAQIDQRHGLDLNPYLPLPRLQLKYLLKEWIHSEGISLSYELLNGAVDALIAADCARFCSGQGGFEIRKGVVFLIKNETNVLF